jgi:tRNA (guanine-N7-)-methyltransferase
MRLRNIPHADDVILAHSAAIKNETEQKGHWHALFGNTNPVHIEIGMGKGQFLLTLAKQNPSVNYIGIERYSSVLLRALEKLDSEEYQELTNIRFICMDATDLPDVFEPGEVAKIYLNFSDPWPKARHAKRRLTSKEFFARYDKILAADGTVEFKTDNRPLFEFSLEQVEEASWTLNAHTFDLHHDPAMNEGNVMTEYEQKFSSMGNPIHKLIASRSSSQCI